MNDELGLQKMWMKAILDYFKALPLTGSAVKKHYKPIADVVYEI